MARASGSSIRHTTGGTGGSASSASSRTRSDGHAAWANSEALRRVPPLPTADPVGGRIERDFERCGCCQDIRCVQRRERSALIQQWHHCLGQQRFDLNWIS